MSDLTADRAGILTCQDQDVYLKLLMKSGGAPKEYFKKNKLNIEPFIKQANEFEKSFNTNSIDQLAKLAVIMEGYLPRAVLRASDLIKWIYLGKYQEILEKDTSKSIFCKGCRFEIQIEDEFCGECGDKIMMKIN